MTENKRIIKFRAWDTKYKVMIEGFAIYDNADHLGMSLSDAEQFYTPEQIEADSDHFCGGDGDWIFIMGEFELLEFTGLTDKNGKEIYEGDIIRGKNGKLWVIEWKDYGWCINNHLIADPKAKFAGPETYGFAYWMRLHPEGHCDVEIIGSLYENPELIKS